MSLESSPEPEKRKIHSSLIQLINQTKPIGIKGSINSIVQKSNLFYLLTDKNEYLECYYDGINNYQEGDLVLIKGRYALGQDAIVANRVYINVEFMDKINDEKKLELLAKNYQKIHRTLCTPKYITIARKFRMRRSPDNVLNVGVIAFTGNNDNIDNFKIAFQEKCVGNLFIYRVDENDPLSLITGMEYFKKYHGIELICFLTNQININQAYDLSSIDIVKYLINRKKYPYIVSITSHLEEFHPIPFSVSLSNKKMDGIYACVNFIHGIQSEFRKKIDQIVSDGINQLRQLIDKQKSRLLECKLLMTELTPLSRMQKLNHMPIEKLKILLLNRISKEKSKMIKLASQLSTNFIYDEHIKAIIDGVTDGKIIPKQDVSDEIEKPRRTKEFAFHQNPYFQTFPGLIAGAINDFDDIISEISHLRPEKIEIKISSDIASDIIENNINSDGDF